MKSKLTLLFAHLAAYWLPAAACLAFTQTDIEGPDGSDSFGASVTMLPNGNFVVIDQFYDQPSPFLNSIGAVYLYSPTGTLISMLTGSTAGDRVGSSGVVVLANGNFVVRSTFWKNGAANNAGAVTWGSATTGFGAAVVPVSSTNSLLGSSTDDNVGIEVTALPNGNYVVSTPSWSVPGGGAAGANVGAVTWGNGYAGTGGAVGSGNSLVGSTAEDQVGSEDLIPLTNGNFVVISPLWNVPAGGTADVGAATWGSGSTGFPTPVAVSSTNSLIGSSTGDFASAAVIPLTNGHYVVANPLWDVPAGDDDVGAVTWGDGNAGRTGVISIGASLVGSTLLDKVGSAVIPLANGNFVVASQFWNIPSGAIDVGAATWANGNGGIVGPVTVTNSLTGTSAGDRVAAFGQVFALTNGNYVVCSEFWKNPATGAGNAGAVTWGNGFSGTTGPVTAANSLVGSTFNDSVGGNGVIALTNGNYVVISPFWDVPGGGTQDVGAVTWGKGTTGVKGIVSAANSLVGSSDGDEVGNIGVFALTNGNYVVCSESWRIPSGPANVGAATWGNGTTGIKGVVSAANSLVGATAEDAVGNGGAVALTNGNYVVISSAWNVPGGANNAGAVTWGNGSTGIKGVVSAANSLVGSSNNDFLGISGVAALTNGNYVVASHKWSNPSPFVSEVGAVTWGNGSVGIKGPVSAANSLVGNVLDDHVGGAGGFPLSNGDYVVVSSQWDKPSPATVNSGAVTLGNGATGTVGPVIPAHSVLGDDPSSGSVLEFDFDPIRELLVVGRRNDGAGERGMVTLFGNFFLRSLAMTNLAAPGALNIAFSTPGTAAVNDSGAVLCDYLLIGTGAAGGKNRAIFASPPFGGPLDLVMRTGDSLAALGGGLPGNAKAIALSGQVSQQIGRGLFQATISGTGIAATNNRLLLIDNGAAVSLVQRTGQPIAALSNATMSEFREVLQSHEIDLITLSYRLKPSATPGVTSANDTGVLPLTHSGAVMNLNVFAREGSPAVNAAGASAGFFGEFSGRATAVLGNRIMFGALFKPAASAAGKAALFRMQANADGGGTPIRIAMAGENAPLTGYPDNGTPKFSTFPAVGGLDEEILYRATLSGSSPATNEGLWRGPGTPAPILRKGDPIAGLPPGVVVSRIIRFWPVSTSQIIIHAKLSGPGVTTANNEVFVLRQVTNGFLILMRKGDSPPGVGSARLLAFSAVDVNPANGRYAVLGALSNAPTTTNQALWTGSTSAGDDTTDQFKRLPLLRLRKGDHYSTQLTPLGLVKSMTLKPAVDATGAGGRGLAQAIGSGGEVAIYLLGDRGLTELVLLPP